MLPLLVEKDNIGVATSYIMVGESISSMFASIFGAILIEWITVTNAIMILSVIILIALIVFSLIYIEKSVENEDQEKSSIVLIKETLQIIMHNSFLKRIVVLAPLIGVTYVFF